MLEVSSFIKGEWHAPIHNASSIYDAVTGKVIGKVGHGGLPSAEIINYAKENGGKQLRALGFHQRAKMIKALALYMMDHKDPLYELSFHSGATKKDSIIDIDGGIQTMLVFASKGRREMPDGQIYVDGNIEELSRDQSFKGIHIATPLLGVALHINAFNFPVWGMLEKMAPALLAGMPVIVKPASQTSYITEAAFRLIIDSGILPDGAVQLISGSAGDLIDHLGSQDVVSFTGSATTALKLKSNPNLLKSSVRFIAEQDSLNATVLGADITPDGPDFNIFIKEVIREMTTKAGQKCTAIRRILVPETHLDVTIQALSDKLDKVNMGDPKAGETTMGALVSIDQCNDVRNCAYQISKESICVYGEVPAQAFSIGQSAFFAPLLFHCKNPDTSDTVHSVEAFGPVSTIIGYRDEAHAIDLVNMGQGSLVASVFTGSVKIARAFAYASGPWHGRLYFNNTKSAKAATGHGAPLPHMIHGGPGRAGGGEEMGGIRGVMHYMQRTAIQGHPDILSGIIEQYVPDAETSHASAHPFTRTYNQLQIGESITTKKRTITLEDIEHFANFTGDKFYAHMDEEAATANPFFPGRVAHGYLLLSFAAGLFVEPSPGPVLANTGLNNLSFFKPVVAGDSIGITLTVKRKTRRTEEYGEVRWHVEIKNQTEEMVASYELLTMNAYENPYEHVRTYEYDYAN